MDTTQKPEGCPIELEKTPTSLKLSVPPAIEEYPDIITIFKIYAVVTLVLTVLLLFDVRSKYAYLSGQDYVATVGVAILMGSLFMRQRILLLRSSVLSLDINNSILEITHKLSSFRQTLKKPLSDIDCIEIGIEKEEKQLMYQSSANSSEPKYMSIEFSSNKILAPFILSNPFALNRFTKYEIELETTQHNMDRIILAFRELIEFNKLPIEIQFIEIDFNDYGD
jgi:hypothetical protein